MVLGLPLCLPDVHDMHLQVSKKAASKAGVRRQRRLPLAASLLCCRLQQLLARALELLADEPEERLLLRGEENQLLSGTVPLIE